MKLKLFLFITILFAITSIVAVSSSEQDNDKPITGDFNGAAVVRFEPR